jgi:predicted dehydrogenase
MSKLKLEIVGTGFIAGAIADAIGRSQNCMLTAVAIRKQETANTRGADGTQRRRCGLYSDPDRREGGDRTRCGGGQQAYPGR